MTLASSTFGGASAPRLQTDQRSNPSRMLRIDPESTSYNEYSFS